MDQATTKYRHLRGIRLFAIYARRFYYDRPENVETEKTDLQIGMDYYYDNLFVSDCWCNRDVVALQIERQ